MTPDPTPDIAHYRLTYETTPATVITFVLRGETLNPDDITARLGVTPFKGWARGEHNLPRAAHAGAWFLAPACTPDEPLETQLHILLTHLESLQPVLSEFIATYEAVISIGYSSGEANFGFLLDTGTLERLARLHLSLDVDIYVVAADHSDNSGEEKATL